MLEAAGIAVLDLGLHGTTPEKVRITTGGRPLLRLDRGGEQGEVGAPGEAVRDAIAAAAGLLVADYGRGVAAQPALRAALGAPGGPPLVWDPHPRGPAPTAGAALVTPNLAEATALVPEPAGDGLREVAARARALAARWRAGHVCVTWGARGAVLSAAGGPPLAVAAEAAPGGDPCGAGDRFASRAASVLAAGASVHEAVQDAVLAASRFVAAGGAGAFAGPGEPLPGAPGLGPGPGARPAIRSRSPAPCAPPAGRSSPPAAASTSSIPATSVRSRRRGRSATASSCSSTPTRRCAA